MTASTVTLMADYNRWMNQRLYEAASTLPARDLEADRGTFFGSVLGTLNHIVVGDIIWLHRFARLAGGFPSLAALSEFPVPVSLRQPVATDLAGLWAARARLDALICTWAGEVTPAQLASALAYANMAGERSSRNFGHLVQHFFNHQTHHRGQVTTLLCQAGIDVGVTDLLAVIPDSGR